VCEAHTGCTGCRSIRETAPCLREGSGGASMVMRWRKKKREGPQ
jgi:hypothetical protein